MKLLIWIPIFLTAWTGVCAADSKADVSIYTMDCGLFFMKNVEVYDSRLKGIDRPMANPCYLIKHGSQYMMWDVGEPDYMATSYARVWHHDTINPWSSHPANSTLYLTLSRTLASQLATLHLHPSDVSIIGVASFTSDHTGNLALFPQATLLIDEKEYATWQAPEIQKLMDKYYGKKAWGGADVVARGMKKVLIAHSEPYDVFGDGTVVIYPAPGHTPGQRIVLIRLPQSGPYLITGDVYDVRELREFQLQGVPFAGWPSTPQIQETIKSQDALEALVKRTGAKVILPHDYGDFFAMPAFPDALH